MTDAFKVASFRRIDSQQISDYIIYMNWQEANWSV